MSANLPKIYLARHGETEWSLSGQHTGRTDLPLTPNGERAAAAVGRRLAGLSFPLILTSPRRRAMHTAELAGFRAVVEPNLEEWNYGDYEGLTTKQIRERNPSWDLFRDGCPSGEMPAQIGARVDNLIARVRASGGDALLFAHGHVLRVFGARWLGLPVDEARCFLLTTASVSVLSYEHNINEPAIRLWNDDHHVGA
jgi:broad specificity phosphatase PhoE